MNARRRALVTGASSGIGRAIAERLLADGHAVVGVGRDAARLDLDGDAFSPEVLDLADLDALPSRLDELARRHPDVDALVLAAGRGALGGLESFAYREIRALVDLDFTAQAFFARAFLPGMKRRGRGDLLFLGSEAALRGARQGSIYCAAKFALRGFAQALREECSKSGVRVTILHPGMVRTPFFDDLPIAPGGDADNALAPEDVAAAAALALSLPPGAVVDEIALSPLKKVVRKTPPKNGGEGGGEGGGGEGA